KIFLGKAVGVVNPVIYVGSKTGRDGIHGATMASGEFDEKSDEQRPTVQVGDPFTEKLLIEACLEAMKTDFIVGIQDMGAAGLTSSSCEMAGRAGNGIEIDVGKVPRREEGMTPYEILLSESQERMLIVSRRGCEEQLCEIFRKWDLDAVTIGKVTDDGILRITENGLKAAEIPALAISENAPKYDRPSKEPLYFNELKNLDLASLPVPEDLSKVLLELLGSLNIASKSWISRQYDHMVRTNTVVLPGSDASVLRIKGTNKGVAIASDCNARYCYLNPFEGGKIAVSEAARNVACSGGQPVALTDNLNFGNPEKPEVMWQMKEAIRGIATACKALNVQVVSGNVSLYNETKGEGIYPTPTIGMVGVVENIKAVATQWFKDVGDHIFLIGPSGGQGFGIGASEYLSLIHGKVGGEVPEVDLETEFALHKAVLAAVSAGIIQSAHDCSEGGLGVAVSESCISGRECGQTPFFSERHSREF
ncbi:MAG: phosphoribosylformylglycinamidine synthase subunit PurL, partial [Nitrospinota bacterium]